MDLSQNAISCFESRPEISGSCSNLAWVSQGFNLFYIFSDFRNIIFIFASAVNGIGNHFKGEFDSCQECPDSIGYAVGQVLLRCKSFWIFYAILLNILSIIVMEEKGDIFTRAECSPSTNFEAAYSIFIKSLDKKKVQKKAGSVRNKKIGTEK
jgi:hypothetical protein